MLKTFLLKKIEEEITSSTEGKMTFHLQDESGVVRSVWGTTSIDENNHPVTISANKKREHPLIQCLFRSQVNETIKIEFTQYNEVFARKDDAAEEVTVEELMKEMQSKPLRMGDMIELVK